MAEHLSAGHHLEGNAAKARGDLDARVAWVLANGPPLPGHGAEVTIADGQIVGDARMAARSLRLAQRTSGPLGRSTWSL